MNRIKAWLWHLPFVERIVERSKHTSLIGFNGLPIYTVLDFFFKEIQKEHLNTKATSLAFSFFLAIFPATIFLFTLIPYIPVSNFQDQLLNILSQVLPANAYEAVQTTLTDIIKNKNGGLLSFGFVAALFFSSNGLMALMRNFNKASLILDKRPGWKKRRTAIVLTVVISIMLITGVSLIIAGNYIINRIEELEIIHGELTKYSLMMVNYVIILLLFFSIISTLYYFGPATIKKFKFFSAGATLATVLSILSSTGFAFYVNNFSSYNKVYGSIGTLIVIMIWLYLNSMILLIGFELNASINILKRNLPEPVKKRMGNRLRTNEFTN
jgi:membrane protein